VSQKFSVAVIIIIIIIIIKYDISKLYVRGKRKGQDWYKSKRHMKQK